MKEKEMFAMDKKLRDEQAKRLAQGKHTPGPWRTGDRFNTVFGPNLGKPSPVTIATVARGNEANARLIAAAPELLEALRIAYRLLGEIKQDGYAGIHLPTLDWVLEGDETGDSQLMAAIAKAEERK